MTSADVLTGAGLIALAGAGAAARAGRAVLHRRDGSLLDAARLLEVLLAADATRLLLSALVLDPARAAGRVPYMGAERLAFHASQALFLAWPVGVAALVARLFARGPTWLAFALLLPVAMIFFAGTYPSLRGAELGDAYRAAQVGAIALALASLTLPRPAAIRAGRGHLVALFLLGGVTAELAGPYVAEPFASWWTAQISWLVVLGAIVVASTWSTQWAPRRG